MTTQKKIFTILIAVILLIGIMMLKLPHNVKKTPSKSSMSPNEITVTPVKTETFSTYKSPKIPKKTEYTIFLLGDSMTFALGPHGGTFNEKINKLYPGDRPGILIDNYSQSSTNILSVKEAINKKITNLDATFEPMLNRKVDIIMIESFGYNPLSQLGIEEGLKVQTKTLNELMQLFTTKFPNTEIIFVATISPNKALYGSTTQVRDTSGRIKEAEERIKYIKNHIDFAKSHSIPIVNIYEKTLTPEGDGKLEYINPDDYIHPSGSGVDFISGQLAEFIYNNKTLPL